MNPVQAPARVMASAALVLLSAPSWAQDTPVELEDSTPVVTGKSDYMSLGRHERGRLTLANRPPVSFFMEGGAQWSSDADLDDASGDVSVTRLRAAVGVSFRLSENTDLILRGGTEFSFYDFSGATGLLPGAPTVSEPFDDVHATSFSPLIRVIPEHGWNWFIGGTVMSAGESGADFSDTLLGGGIAGASYDITDRLRLGVGISVASRFEGGVWVFPFPIIAWDITDDLTLRTVERGVALEYWFHESWNVALVAGYEHREYRLADDNPLPEGSVTDRRVPVALALTYFPSSRVVISGRIGAEVWGELEFHDRDENKVASTDLGTAMVVGFDLRIAF